MKNSGALRAMARALAVLSLSALVLSACSGSYSASSSESAPPRDSHPTPAQQGAAQIATATVRTQMTTAGVELAAALSSVDTAVHAGHSAAATAALEQAAAIYDTVLGDVGSATTSTDEGAPLTGVQVDAASLRLLATQVATDKNPGPLAAELDGQGPSIELLLAHRVLDPQDIAIELQGELAWVALQAPTALSITPSFGATKADLVGVAQMAQGAIHALAPLGTMLAPKATAASVRQVDALVAELDLPSSSARSVVSLSDATIAPLGELAGSLAGTGVHVQGYQ